MTIFTLMGFLATLLGSVAIYLASPNQRWRATSWPAPPARTTGVLLLAVGLISLLQALRPAAGTFVFVHWLMLLFALFPYFGALLASRRNTHS
ncbi:hypothetical protein J5J83_04755 [Azoarcus sp. L1K30]|uniref:hypothetical protein n=1 Tax=Azoarcus sp. L1K30 TaxID=2820277 RepID=UPI001B8369D6|nr:hypothetical protein [Azoarcus sp. L1K30]MBR0565427.1 hypothetical protein [Azoarcus sp. L1K30]